MNNQTKKQFMERVASYSTVASRRGVNLLGWEDVEDLTPEEERDCIVQAKKRVQEVLENLPKRHPERKQLGQLQYELDKRINQIRPKMRCKGIENYVMDVLRNELTNFQFDLLMQKAKKLRAKDEPLINQRARTNE